MKIIDFRFRPPFGKYLSNAPGSTSTMFNVPEDGSGRTFFGAPFAESVCKKSMALCLKEMDEAGIVLGVSPVRKAFGMQNEELLPLLEEYPDRFAGIACIEPMEGISAALDEIDRFVLNGPMKGIILESGLDRRPWYFDDKIIDPIFEKCEKEDILVLTTFGGLDAPGPDYYFPWRIENVARKFPKMRLVVCHGGWPWVTQMCHISYTMPNVYIAPEVYMTSDSFGKNDYIMAGNYLLKDKMVYGSCYPYQDHKVMIQSYLHDGLREEVLENIMYNNAAKLLGIN